MISVQPQNRSIGSKIRKTTPQTWTQPAASPVPPLPTGKWKSCHHSRVWTAGWQSVGRCWKLPCWWGGRGALWGSKEEDKTVGSRRNDWGNGLLTVQVGLFLFHTGRVVIVDFTWENPSTTPPPCGRTDSARGLVSWASLLILSLVHPTSAKTAKPDQIWAQKKEKGAYTVHRQRQCHECQLHCSYLEIRFNLISHCLHLSWVNNKNGLFPGSPGGETNLKMVNSRNSRRAILCIWISLLVCVSGYCMYEDVSLH